MLERGQDGRLWARYVMSAAAIAAISALTSACYGGWFDGSARSCKLGLTHLYGSGDIVGYMGAANVIYIYMAIQ